MLAWWRDSSDGEMVPRWEGAIVIAKGVVSDVIAKMIEEAHAEVSDPAAITTRKFGNHELRFFEVPGSIGKGVAWGEIEGYWIAGAGSLTSIENWIAGSDEESNGFQERMAPVAVPRPWASLSIDVAAFLSNIQDQEASQFLERMGLSSVERMTTQVGFDDEGYLHRSLLKIQGAPRGLVELLMSAGDSQSLPSVSETATAVVASTWDLSSLASLVSDPANEEAKKTLSELAEAFAAGFVLQHDATDGGWINGFSLQIPVRNQAAAARYLDAQLTRVEADMQIRAQEWFAPRLRSVDYGDSRIHSIRYPFFPWGPTWALTDRALVIGVDPIALRGVIDRLEGKRTGVPVPEFQAGETLVTSVDLNQLQGMPLGLGLVFGRLLAQDFGRTGSESGMAQSFSRLMLAWPGSEGLRGLRTENRLSVVAATDGIELQGRFSFPGAELALLLTGAVGIAAAGESMGMDVTGLAMPARARSATAMNNLKQIALAMHNYHDTYQSFPGNVKDDRGKPLLSWRVLLLPYLEQNELYQQFHLDEPWDSPHNLALVEKMPEVYRAPGSQAAPGMTNYVVIESENGILPNGDGVRFRDITDGTSMTIMLVEANDASAVEWTRPSDLQPDMDLILQLIGLRGRSFLAAFADGSVQEFEESIEPERLEAFITRSGGEVVER